MTIHNPVGKSREKVGMGRELYKRLGIEQYWTEDGKKKKSPSSAEGSLFRTSASGRKSKGVLGVGTHEKML